VRNKGIVAGFVVGLLVGLAIAPGLVHPAGTDDWDSWKEKFFEPLAYAARSIQLRYVEEVDANKVLEGAYEGMLNRLDEYSTFIPAKMLEEFEGDTKGEFGGLGIQIRFDPLKKMLVVEQPIPGTPAFNAGVLAGDVITKIREIATNEEWDPAKFEDVHDAVRVLRGEPGTQVMIKVFHELSRKEEEVTITREIIKVPGVRAVSMVNEEHKIGYVYVAYFHENTASELREAIQKLKEQGMKALVVDLRFNPGGLLTSAVDVSDVFLQDSLVVSTRGRADPEKIFRAKTGDGTDGMPIAILVNRYSASASEIVAGAIKDNKRGLIIGEKTYGKGSVQTIIPLRDRKSAFKLTTARYYTPSGECIDKIGVKPDIAVALTDAETRQLVQALAENTEYPPKPKDNEPQPSQPAEQPSKDKEKLPAFRDIQLERAVDAMIAVIIEGERRNVPAAAPTESAKR
jgi:carboxyl-terminal processing protease